MASASTFGKCITKRKKERKMLPGMRLSNVLSDIIGQQVLVDCQGSCYHRWQGKVVSYSGSDGSGSELEEAGMNVVCDMMDTRGQVIRRLSFDPSALKFL